MSIRTILEINHDCLHSLERMSADELRDLLYKVTNCNAELNASEHGYRAHNGVTVMASTHHSSKVDLSVNGRVVYRNYVTGDLNNG
ncbi:hypothetical protein [uncultured Paraglaciecola sp.]|uniref:hypothetical protein n=1 Tax=uncultured Paraglaciecola sp. TaxID=1765024 RepID=UPI0026348ADF|nr:hypothetical protein [uncultured Paraglaciecola sp.]